MHAPGGRRSSSTARCAGWGKAVPGATGGGIVWALAFPGPVLRFIPGHWTVAASAPDGARTPAVPPGVYRIRGGGAPHPARASRSSLETLRVSHAPALRPVDDSHLRCSDSFPEGEVVNRTFGPLTLATLDDSQPRVPGFLLHRRGPPNSSQSPLTRGTSGRLDKHRAYQEGKPKQQAPVVRYNRKLGVKKRVFSPSVIQARPNRSFSGRAQYPRRRGRQQPQYRHRGEGYRRS